MEKAKSMEKVLCIGHAAYDITLPLETFPKENSKVRIGDKSFLFMERSQYPTILSILFKKRSIEIGMGRTCRITISAKCEYSCPIQVFQGTDKMF